MSAETVIDVVGATPLVRLEHLVPHNGSESSKAIILPAPSRTALPDP